MDVRDAAVMFLRRPQGQSIVPAWQRRGTHSCSHPYIPLKTMTTLSISGIMTANPSPPPGVGPQFDRTVQGASMLFGKLFARLAAVNDCAQVVVGSELYAAIERSP